MLNNQPGFLKAEILLFGNYNVVENSEAEDFSCFGKLLMGFCVNVAWLGVAGWMIMGKDDGSGTVCDNIGKDFTGMNLAAVHQANGDDAFFYDLVSSVKGYANKIFLLFIDDIRNQRKDIFCTFDLYRFF